MRNVWFQWALFAMTIVCPIDKRSTPRDGTDQEYHSYWLVTDALMALIRY